MSRVEHLAEGVRFHFGSCDPSEAWPLIRDHHYSGRMPSNIQHVYCLRTSGGIFGEHGRVVAACIFSLPPTRWGEEVLELSRLVREPEIITPLSSLISNSCKWLRRAKWNLIISFADATHGHHGGVYQAAGWKYAGQRQRSIDGVIWRGSFVPGRSCNSRWGTRSPSKLTELLHEQISPHYNDGKHLYWNAIHRSGYSKAKKLNLIQSAYPKTATRRMDAEATIFCEPGATPGGRSKTIDQDA